MSRWLPLTVSSLVALILLYKIILNIKESYFFMREYLGTIYIHEKELLNKCSCNCIELYVNVTIYM